MIDQLKPCDGDIEPTIEAMLNDALELRKLPPYRVNTLPEVQAKLEAFFRDDPTLDSPGVEGLKHLGGGASKEQYVFDLTQVNADSQRCVLRMDPLESAVVTSREREAAILALMQGAVPAPKPLWSDFTGEKLGRPAMITDFIPGVTKPSDSSSNVSGFGTVFDKKTRAALAKSFMRHFATMHSVDWRNSGYECFQAPTADQQQAARWQLNWWTKVWHDDVAQGYPLMGLAERWMRDNLPSIPEQDLVFVHSDYRTGNFLYDEASLEITTVLDWELIHIGDYHEDLAWAAISTWSTMEEGVLLASGLMPLQQLCDQYSEATGRAINMKNLYFYQVLGLYKCVAICLATSINAARHSHNHQDALLSWLGAAGYTFLDDLHALLEGGCPE